MRLSFRLLGRRVQYGNGNWQRWRPVVGQRGAPDMDIAQCRKVSSDCGSFLQASRAGNLTLSCRIVVDTVLPGKIHHHSLHNGSLVVH